MLLLTAMTTQNFENLENERLRQLFQQAPGFICVLRGPQHIFELANNAYYQLIGHRQVQGRVLSQALPEVIEQGYLEKLDRVFLTGEPFIGRALPIQLQSLAGGPLQQSYIDLIYQPIRDSNGQVSGIFVQGHDVTEAHQLAQEISYQASHDFVTGIFNRREFEKHSHAIEALPGPHALLYMDLDHFKIVNDRGGHAAGDALLHQVAMVLRKYIRESDVLARLGGDEFALILPDCSGEYAASIARTLCGGVRDIIFFWNGIRYSVTLSVGLVEFGTCTSLAFSDAFSLADIACFLAKEKGRNRVQVSHASDLEVTARQNDMDWANRIKDCIKEDRVVLHAQSLSALSARHETMQCREILARMRDKQGNLIFPGSFISSAERFGIIEDLDFHIIRKSFAHLQNLPAEQRAITRYFINVSGITLNSPGFSEYIASMLEDYTDVHPCHVCFEVTETAAISNLDETANVIRGLTKQGFSFAIDDFGSGMASFSYLQKLPVQYLKIDGEFIKGILTQPAGLSIVEAVVKVARAMNILTVAESVEFPELLPALREIGVDYGQGYALHRPEPI